MKKVFVSVPMRGRTEFDIQGSLNRMFAIAKCLWGEDLEMVNNFDPEPIPEAYANKRPSIYYLGEAIKKMADCDYFIGPCWQLMRDYPGCNVECKVAESYNIPRFEVDGCYLFEDIAAKHKNNNMEQYGLD